MSLTPFHFEQVHRRSDECRTPGSCFEDVRRIVVVRDDKLGDFVLTIPAIAALRKAYPSAELVVIVSPAVAPLARLVTPIDRVLIQGEDVSSATELLSTVSADLVVSISRGWGTAWSAFRSGVRHRVGTGRRWYSPLFTRRVVEPRRSSGRHELEYSLSFAHRVGAGDVGVQFPIRTPGVVRKSAAVWLRARSIASDFVLLHPGTGGSCPSWPLTHWRELSERLTRTGVSHIVSAGPEDLDVANGFRDDSNVSVFSGDLPALTAMLAAARLVVSNSTGPIHLAAALGTPTLSIHAPWATCGVTRWGPYAENGHAIVGSMPSVSRWTRRRRSRFAAGLMGGIPVNEVQRWIVESALTVPRVKQ